MACRAVATSAIREACKTGIDSSRFTWALQSRKGADGVPIEGMTCANV